jgi:hypothetical protein
MHQQLGARGFVAQPRMSSCPPGSVLPCSAPLAVLAPRSSVANLPACLLACCACCLPTGNPASRLCCQRQISPPASWLALADPACPWLARPDQQWLPRPCQLLPLGLTAQIWRMDFSEPYRCAGPIAHSPDGRLLAIAVEYRLFIRDTDSLNVVQLYTCLDKIHSVEWSANSQYVLCGEQRREGGRAGARCQLRPALAAQVTHSAPALPTGCRAVRPGRGADLVGVRLGVDLQNRRRPCRCAPQHPQNGGAGSSPHPARWPGQLQAPAACPVTLEPLVRATRAAAAAAHSLACRTLPRSTPPSCWRTTAPTGSRPQPSCLPMW